MNYKTVILIGLALLVLIGVMIASFFVWQKMGAVALGFHGWLALSIGVLVSFVLGGGLMMLSFYSSRSGHDETARLQQKRSKKGASKKRG